MMKKIICIVITLVLCVSLSTAVFATGGVAVNTDDSFQAALDRIVRSKNIEETPQFLVTITRPASNEMVRNTTGRSYIISGITARSDITVVLAIRDEATGNYNYFKNTEGFSSWNIGSIGIFTKEVSLNQGPNNLKIIAYRNSEKENLEVGKNVQVNYFTVTVLRETMRERFINTFDKINDMIRGIIN